MARDKALNKEENAKIVKEGRTSWFIATYK